MPAHGKSQLVYVFCRLQAPAIAIPGDRFAQHLDRMFKLAQSKVSGLTWEQYLDKLYAVDSFLASACLEGHQRGWEALFSARAGRADRLLVDALRARAVRLFPHDEERQDTAVTDFWGHLIVSETPGSVPILARYDAMRPLVPWLIRTFQNWQISLLRAHAGRSEALPDDDLLTEPTAARDPDLRWHEIFCQSAREWLSALTDNDLMFLGLRMRYRLSQRDVAELLEVHEGTISRRVTQLRDTCLEAVGKELLSAGWDGDDLSGFIYSEMASLLMDEPRLSADSLAKLLGTKGKRLPEV
jgi:RNA polymerase sigma factor (sigma-70 family)